MVLLLLVSLCCAGNTAVGGLLGSSNYSVEISALVFCSMMLWDGGGGFCRGVWCQGFCRGICCRGWPGGGLVSFRICEGFVLRSTSHLRFSVTCDAT